MFYWHVSDSQSFPLRISGFEELALKGAYSNASIFTTDDVAVIVQYAGEVRVYAIQSFLILNTNIQRGIDVVLVGIILDSVELAPIKFRNSTPPDIPLQSANLTQNILPAFNLRNG